MKVHYLYIVLGAFVLWSCQQAEKQPNKTVCVLFDLSESTRNEEIRKTYENNYKLINSTINPGDVITACPITEKSASEQRLILNCEFPVFAAQHDTEIYMRAEEKQFLKKCQFMKDSLLYIVDSMLIRSKRIIKKTEILSSLQVAERIFKNYFRPKQVLVIMSDMLEDSEDWNFTQENLDDRRIAFILDEIKKKNGLAELKGVKIYVTGAMAKKNEKLQQVRQFWLKYFELSGAVLLPENYGATLIRFNE